MPTLTELLAGMGSRDATTAFQSYDQLPAVNAPNPFTSPGEMRPANLSWRDRIAAALMGDMPANSPRGRGVEALMGSTGLGQRGMGAVDLTPAGIPLAGQEMHRAGMAGDYAGAALAGLGILPAARPVGAAATGIRAYHGSPHKFDAFDLSKIGTGEGAQAYGHGLYFASNEDVAWSYRKALSPTGVEYVFPDGRSYFSGGNSYHELMKTLDMIPSPPGVDNGLRRSVAGALMEGADDITAAAMKRYFGDMPLPPERKAKYEAQIGQIVDAMGPMQKRQPGHMYEVNINADPARLLNWDAPISTDDPLRKALSDKVAGFMQGDAASREAGRLAYRSAENPNLTGEGAWRTFSSLYGPSGAAAELKDMGIPGVRYLDGGSRGAGAGSHNYVVFDDKLIDILRRYGLGGIMVGGAAAAGAGVVPNPLSKRLSDTFGDDPAY